MSTGHDNSPRRQQHARAALASYLRLLAACLEDEADLIENDPERCDDVLRRFREGVLTLSLEEAPVDALMDRVSPLPGDLGRPRENGKSILLSGSPDSPSPRRRSSLASAAQPAARYRGGSRTPSPSCPNAPR